MKLSSWALPSALSPVMRMTYLLFLPAIGAGVDQGLAHAFGVVDVFAEDNGLGVAIGGLEKLGDFRGDQLGALVENEVAVHVALVVFAVFNLEAVSVNFAGFRTPAVEVSVEPDAHDFIGREEPVADALARRE